MCVVVRVGVNRSHCHRRHVKSNVTYLGTRGPSYTSVYIKKGDAVTDWCTLTTYHTTLTQIQPKTQLVYQQVIGYHGHPKAFAARSTSACHHSDCAYHGCNILFVMVPSRFWDYLLT
jgi:hypothetical protein